MRTRAKRAGTWAAQTCHGILSLGDIDLVTLAMRRPADPVTLGFPSRDKSQDTTPEPPMENVEQAGRGSTAQGRFDSVDLSAEIVAWVELRCQGTAERMAMRLYNYLRDGGVARAAAGPFRDALADRFGCIAGLFPSVATPGRASPPSRLTEWLDSAEKIAGRWPPRDQEDWTALILDLTEEEDRVAVACVSQSLREGLRGLSAASGLHECAGELAQLDSRYWFDFALPPAEGRPLDPGVYVSPASSDDLLSRLEQTHESLSDLADSLERRRRDEPQIDSSLLADVLCAAAQSEFAGLLRSARSGLPVDRDSIVACTSVLVERLEELAQRFPVDPPEERTSLHKLAAEIDALRASFAGGPSASRLEGPEPESTATPEDAAEGSPSLAGELGALADVIGRQSDARATDLAARFREMTAEPAATTDTEANLRRRALSCLMGVDDLVCQSRTVPPWLADTRTRLRTLLLAGGEYVLLERDLLGRPVHACAHLVEAAGLVDGGATDHIVSVERPGYAIRLADGSQQVLRPARVLLSR